jgi:hypothetical protein
MMVDACRIVRDRPGTSDDTFDPETGDLVPPSSDDSTVYDGKCLLTELQAGDQVVERGGRDQYRRRYQLSIPIDAPAVEPGDVVAVTKSADPQLLDRRLRVIQPSLGSVLVRRRIECELFDRGPRA